MIRKNAALSPSIEGSQIVSMLDSLTTNATVEADIVLIKAAAILGKELTGALTTRDPEEKLQRLNQTLADTRSFRTTASKIPDDGLTDYAWAAIGAWWKILMKYGVSAVKNPEGVSTTTRNSTLSKFDALIKFLKAEIAKTKLELAQAKRST